MSYMWRNIGLFRERDMATLPPPLDTEGPSRWVILSALFAGMFLAFAIFLIVWA